MSAQSPGNAEPRLRDPPVTERSGSRVSIHRGFRHRVRVSRGTVCSLGQPNKAIGLESQIEPWLATAATLLAGAKKPHGTTPRFMGSESSHGRGHANNAPAPSLAAAYGGWMSENHPSWRRGKVFSLDIPFYRTLYTSSGSPVMVYNLHIRLEAM